MQAFRNQVAGWVGPRQFQAETDVGVLHHVEDEFVAVFGVGLVVFEQLAQLLASQLAVLLNELGAGKDPVDCAG